MTNEQLQEIKKIENEIKTLKEFIEPITCEKREDRRFLKSISIHYQEKHDSYEKTKVFFPNDDSTPSFLQELLTDDLDFVLSKIVHKVEKRVKELEKELSKI